MYKHLYNCFESWFHGGTVWFYADPHFADEEMKYLRKNYIGDEEQIARINSKIGKNDTIVILGDIGDKEWLRKIRGYKVLLLGNHDAGATNYLGYADEVYEGPLWISEKILLSHEPIDFPFVFNIHGHVHGAPTMGTNHFNCCAELIDYTPVPLSFFLKNGMIKNTISLHRATINQAKTTQSLEELVNKFENSLS